MSAPEKNQFWKARSSHGRKPIFESDEQLWGAACEYFQWVEDNPLWEDSTFHYQGTAVPNPLSKMRAMTIEGLCHFLDISRQTWLNYCERDDFLEVCERILNVIREQKFTGAAAGLLNASIIARDLGLKESSAHELSGPNGGPIQSESTVTLSAEEAYKRMLDGEA